MSTPIHRLTSQRVQTSYQLPSEFIIQSDHAFILSGEEIPPESISHRDNVIGEPSGSSSKCQAALSANVYTARAIVTTGSQRFYSRDAGDHRAALATGAPNKQEIARRNKVYEAKHKEKKKDVRGDLRSAVDSLVGPPEKGRRRTELEYDRLATASVIECGQLRKEIVTLKLQLRMDESDETIERTVDHPMPEMPSAHETFEDNAFQDPEPWSNFLDQAFPF